MRSTSRVRAYGLGSRDAASTIFNLPGYQVLSAVDLPEGGRRVEVASSAPPGCPGYGVIAVRVHSVRRQSLRDVPVGGSAAQSPVALVWVKMRWFCDQARCGRRTFSEVTDQVPAFARSTRRLRQALLGGVVLSGRAVSEVARAHGVSWWLVQTVVTAAAVVLADPDDVPVRRLGVDEHRYRSVRFYRDQDGAWARYEPGGTSRSRGRMTTFVDAESGRVLGVVVPRRREVPPGRDSAGVGAWLAARTPAWRERVEVVAIDPSAAFRRALRELGAPPACGGLPHAAISVDAFHLVKLANDAVTQVRQRVTRQAKGRRGRGTDPAWVNRRLLLRAGDTLSARALARLKATLSADDPTDEIVPREREVPPAAWGIKEQLRRLLSSTTLAEAEHHRMLLATYVLGAAMPETDRLMNTVNTWWPAVEVLIITGVTNARTEAANTSIKLLKRTGRWGHLPLAGDYRNPTNYRARILLASAA